MITNKNRNRSGTLSVFGGVKRGRHGVVNMGSATYYGLECLFCAGHI